MKRILLVAHSLQVGGVERNTINLANTLVSMGHEVHILALKKRYQLHPHPTVHVHFVDFDRINRYTLIGLIYDWFTRAFLATLIPRSGFVWRGLYGGWYFRFFIHRLEKQFGPIDKIIIRGQGAFERVWSYRDSRLYQVIVSPLNVPIHPWLDHWYTRLLYGGKNLVANSSGTYQSVCEKLATRGVQAKSLNLISNPCPLDEVRRLAEEAAPVPAQPYIVHVARLTYQKNQALLIEAYHRANIEEQLVIVGGGQDEPDLRRLTHKLGLDGRVIFAGQQENPYPWMKHAKLFVLSSRFEGLGLVMVESLACGTPVVAADCPGGVRDVLIDEQAKLIARPNVDDLATKIREALTNPIHVKPEWVQRFDASAIANQFLALP